MVRNQALVTSLCLWLLMSVPAGAVGWNASGTWETKVMGATIRAKVTQNGDSVRGIVKVYQPSGKKDTYTFLGHVRGNQINAAHYSGHSFSGALSQQGSIVGTLTTKGGHRVPITMWRR